MSVFAPFSAIDPSLIASVGATSLNLIKLARSANFGATTHHWLAQIMVRVFRLNQLL
jgi:hypothetical protein